MSLICGMMQLSHRSLGASTPSASLVPPELGRAGDGIFSGDARLLGLESAVFAAVGALGFGASWALCIGGGLQFFFESWPFLCGFTFTWPLGAFLIIGILI